MPQLTDFVRQTLEEKRRELAAAQARELAAVEAKYSDKLRELDAALALDEPQLHTRITHVGPPMVLEASPVAFSTASVVATAMYLISSGVPATTKAIYEALKSAGVMLPADAQYRITKWLSRTGRFKGGWENGWTLKDPASMPDTAPEEEEEDLA